jgi:hypothetical protein
MMLLEESDDSLTGGRMLVTASASYFMVPTQYGATSCAWHSMQQALPVPHVSQELTRRPYHPPECHSVSTYNNSWETPSLQQCLVT